MGWIVAQNNKEGNEIRAYLRKNKNGTATIFLFFRNLSTV